MEKKNIQNNPFDVCTLKEIKECEDCEIKGELKCRFSKRHLLSFLGFFLFFAIPSVIGLILIGYGLYLIGWIVYMLFFFNFWETRILCRHCPFYAEEGRTLHCIANYGCYKLWKYNPKPMSRLEKVQVLLGFTILGGFPLILFFINKAYFLFGISLIGLIIFFTLLSWKTCSKCVNFSCPLNRVPKNIVDTYLKKNITMKKAWEEEGYQIE